MAAPTFNIVSVCAGISGLDLGVKRAIQNARTVLYIEREVSACEILVARMQDGSIDDAPIFTDLAALKGKPWRGVVDCVVAGIPCQGNSLAGKRGLEDDPRNLWPATRRLLRAVGAEWFFLENVYGLLVPERGERHAPISRILGELSEDGWYAEWAVVSASDVGASQQRERVFLLARRLAIGADNGRGLSLAGIAHGSARTPRDGGDDAKPTAGCGRSVVNAGRPELRGRRDARDVPCTASGDQGKEDQRQRHGYAVGDAVSALAMASSPQRGRGSVRRAWWDAIGAMGGGGGAGLPQRGSDGPVQPGTGEPGQGEAAELRDGELAGDDARGCDRQRLRLSERGSLEAVPHVDRSVFGAFPPGPGFGLDRVAQSVLADLESGKVGADDRFLAELAELAKWQVVLERRPDLAPAISDEEEAQLSLRDVADGISGRMDVSRADKLRALGNAVVAEQAAIAFMILWQRLMECEQETDSNN